MAGERNSRHLFIMRHGERVDFTFGTWIDECFDEKGNYTRKNLNLPVTVPKRKGGPLDFLDDCPLTRMGLHQATLTGEAMKSCGVQFSHVFCSPSLRCVETCANTLQAAGLGYLPIHIEPALFEYLEWYRNKMPKWLSIEELNYLGFNIAMNYEPICKVEEMCSIKESIEEFYVRNFLVSKKVLAKYSGNILFVAHAATLDTCSRQLIGKIPRKEAELDALFRNIPFCSVAVVEEQGDRTWKLTKPPFPSLSHLHNKSFQLTDLLDSSH